MTVFGVSMVKNEDDVIKSTIEHMLTHVDHIIIADNLSTDSTRDILDSFDSSVVTVVDDPVVGYYQSKKMTKLAGDAAELGADWVVPFDADEIWFSPYFDSLKEHLESVPEKFVCVVADWYHHGVTNRDDHSINNPFLRMRHRLRKPAEMCKVAARCSPKLIIEQGNHSIQYGGTFLTYELNIEARHFPYRSLDQFARKAIQGVEAYEATNLSKNQGSHWRDMGNRIRAGGDEEAKAIFDSFVIDLDNWQDELVDDPAPIRGLGK